MIKEVIINGRSNSIDLSLTADDVEQSLNSVTKMELVDISGGADIISSADYPNAFDWNTGVKGKVILSLGDVGIAAGHYIFALIVYYVGITAGLEWDRMEVTVR